jgi:hypothetical protein
MAMTGRRLGPPSQVRFCACTSAMLTHACLQAMPDKRWPRVRVIFTPGMGFSIRLGPRTHLGVHTGMGCLIMRWPRAPCEFLQRVE